MYLQHFRLSEKPFQISPDPKFLWLGEKHKEAFANLLYSLIDENGFLVLTGDVGSGKTTLLNALTDRIGRDVQVVNINNPRMSVMEMLIFILRSIDPDSSCSGKVDFITQMDHHLRKAEREGRKILLIIDEAHLLTYEQLEEIRLLSNIESAEKKLINVILTGQNELNETLMSHKCRALRQRVALYYQLQPFSEDETRQYIQHRLQIAGSTEAIFMPAAVSALQRLTGGIPRLINVLSARAMLSAYANGETAIDAGLIRECGEELHFLQEPASEPEPGPAPIRTFNMRRKLGGIAALVLILIPALVLSRQIFFNETNISQAPPDSTIARRIPLEAVQRAAEPVEPVGQKDANPAEKADATVASAMPKNKPAEVSVERSGKSVEKKLPSGAKNDPEPLAVVSARKPEPSSTDADIYAAARNAVEQDDFTHAIALLENHFSKNPKTPYITRALYSLALTGQARKWISSNQQTLSEPLLLKAVEADPNNFEAHFELGKLYTRKKEYPKAIASYRDAAALRPDSASAYYNLGFVYAGSRDYSNAEETFQQAAALDPPFADKVLFNLAVVQLKQGKKRNGIRNLEKSLELNPNNKRAQAFLKKLRSVE